MCSSSDEYGYVAYMHFVNDYIWCTCVGVLGSTLSYPHTKNHIKNPLTLIAHALSYYMMSYHNMTSCDRRVGCYSGKYKYEIEIAIE